MSIWTDLNNPGSTAVDPAVGGNTVGAIGAVAGNTNGNPSPANTPPAPVIIPTPAQATGTGPVGAIQAANTPATLAGNVTATPGTAGQATAAGNVTPGSAGAVHTQVDPITGTVQGQLGKIIDTNSPLLQRATQRAMEAVNSRGLVNSSAAVNAGQGAIIDAALPIAQADAASSNAAANINAQLGTDVSKFNVSTALQAGIVNQDQANRIAQFNAANNQDMSKFNTDELLKAGIINQDQANRMNQFNANQSTQAAEFNASQGNQVAQFNTQSGNQVREFNTQQINDLAKVGVDANTRMSLANIEAQYKTVIQTQGSASDLFRQSMANIAQIMTSKDLDGAAKTQAINNVTQQLNNGLAIVGGINNMNLGQILTFNGGSNTLPSGIPPVDQSALPTVNGSGAISSAQQIDPALQFPGIE